MEAVVANGNGGASEAQDKTRYFCHSCGGVSTHPITVPEADELRKEGHEIEALPLKPRQAEVIRG